jgi:cobalt-zinc-cadmium efflux system outer membrane protein
MKAHIYFLIGLSLAAWDGLEAQMPDSLMNLVLDQNRELKAAREAYQVAIHQAGTGNTPPDPEVDFGYLYGKPAEFGNRIDFEVSQQMDFPTSYVHRSKVKDIRTSRAELEYVRIRQEVLLETWQLWIDRIHLNQLHSMLNDRIRQAHTIQNQVEHQLSTGEIGPLAHSQSNLLVASLEGEMEDVEARMENNRMALEEITGGSPVEIQDTIFPASVRVNSDSLVKDYRLGPAALLYDQNLRLKEQEKNLTVSQHLPKLTAGYYSESIVDQAFRGFRLGVSVPLWEHANTIKKANSEIAFAEAEADHFITRQEREIRQKLNELESLRIRIGKLESALDGTRPLSLLNATLESGEISFSEYFYASDLYFRSQQELLHYKRDLLTLEAELMKVYL